MADRNIYCDDCGTRVGLIRDASLLKGLLFVCPSCKIKSDDLKFRKTSNDLFNNEAFGDIFSGIFNKK